MIDIKECTICSSRDFKAVFPKFGGEYYQCKKCRLLVSNLRFGAEKRHDQDSAFTEDAQRNLSVNIEKEYSEKSQRKYLRELRSLRAFRKKGCLLDVGCGTGGFIFAAKRERWECIGTEVSTQAYQAAKQKSLNVKMGALKDITIEKESLDIIRLNDVIEHLQDPFGDIRICHSLLRPGGLLLLTTVNINSFTFHFLGSRWRYIDPRYHIHLFTHKNISCLLEKSGFSVVSIKTVGIRTDPDRKWQKYLLVPVLKTVVKLLNKGHRMRILAVKK